MQANEPYHGALLWRVLQRLSVRRFSWGGWTLAGDSSEGYFDVILGMAGLNFVAGQARAPLGHAHDCVIITAALDRLVNRVFLGKEGLGGACGEDGVVLILRIIGGRQEAAAVDLEPGEGGVLVRRAEDVAVDGTIANEEGRNPGGMKRRYATRQPPVSDRCGGPAGNLSIGECPIGVSDLRGFWRLFRSG